MHNHPTLSELLEAVRDFLEQRALPELKGRTAFHARVAMNALDIVRRELADGAPAEAAERAGLLALLGDVGEETPTGELDRELCRRIRAGDITLETEGLRRHLWHTTLDRLSVDQPKYATYHKHKP